MARLVRSLTCAVLALPCATTIAKAAPPRDPDLIEGKWYGDAGSPLDSTQLGFEFKRDEKGQIKAYLYEPLLNFYGLELPGSLTKNGAKYDAPQMALNVTLRGDTLIGTYLAPFMPVRLRRAATFPSEVPVPVLPKGPEPKWTTRLGAMIYAPTAVRDSIAYVGNTGGIMYAVRVSDGSFVWTFVAGRPIYGEALPTREHLYFVCDNGFLFKLDRLTGKEIWRYDLDDERVSRPLPHPVIDSVGAQYDFEQNAPLPVLMDSVLYVASGDGNLHAVSAATGQRIWKFEGKGKARTNAAVDGPLVFFGTYSGMVYAVDRRTGREVWHKDTHAEVTSSPVIIDGRLIVGNRGGLLAALEPATGNVLWRLVFWGSSVESTPVPGDSGRFYIGSSDLRRITMIESRTGRVLWRTDVYGISWPRPALTDKMIYVGVIGFSPHDIRQLGSLTALERATGKIAWRRPVPESEALFTGFESSPVVSGKTLIVGGLDGTLYGLPIS